MTTTYAEANDPYVGYSPSPSSPGVNSVVVTPSDTSDFATYPKGIVVVTAGNLVVLPLQAADDGAHLITITSAPCGFVVPFRVRRVMNTGTTATLATIA